MISSDHGLRYGDNYFGEFRGPGDQVILLQLIFDSADECRLFVSPPNLPQIPERDRTFPFNGGGAYEMKEFVARELSEKQSPD